MRRLRFRLWFLDLPLVRRWWRWRYRDVEIASDEASAVRGPGAYPRREDEHA